MSLYSHNPPSRAPLLWTWLLVLVGVVGGCSSTNGTPKAEIGEIAQGGSAEKDRYAVVLYAFPDLHEVVRVKAKMSARWQPFGGMYIHNGEPGEQIMQEETFWKTPSALGIGSDSGTKQLSVHRRLWFRVVAKSLDKQWIAIEVLGDYGDVTQQAGETAAVFSGPRASLGLILNPSTLDVHRAFVGVGRHDHHPSRTVELEVAAPSEMTPFDESAKLIRRWATGVATKVGPDPLRIIDWDFALSRSEIPMRRGKDDAGE